MRLSLLGGFDLAVGGRPARVAPQGQRLLAFLALRDRPLHRAYVSGRLWLEANQDHAFRCLRTTLWRLHQVPAPLVEATTTHLSLAPLAVDVREVAGAAERILRREEPIRTEDVDRLVWAAELLPDWYDDWVVDEREQLHELRLLALEEASDELRAGRHHAAGAAAALAAVAADPLRESARRLLIKSHLAAGNLVEARRQYATFRARLGREAGLQPSAQMLDLVERLGRTEA